MVALLTGVLTVALHYVNLYNGPFLATIRSGHHEGAGLCPQSDVLYPKQHADVWKSLGHDFGEKPFTERAVAWLGGAVRIPYVSTVHSAMRHIFPETLILNEARCRMTAWALLARISVGTHSGRSTITSFTHFPLRTSMIHLF
jgi:hypothetical protein